MALPVTRPVAKQPPTHAPNAALMIDFDNVTMGIRSDLQHELRRLLNSDIIRGKVAVQRAYADWRRYPQYIVPLSEASIDLIFAPAFGSNKKNATDIRLAIDAIELVFTRPEIGTIILLSGDSDFSSLVIKLKEYGKYVIGVGIRESSSDLLIQNCDEYYSYNELAGLTRVADEVTERRDPWELVVDAVLEMKKRRDVMRSDRLKQVMQEIDPSFDEKNVGMSRFSKFVDEARRRGLIATTKLDNGQVEVDLGASAPGGDKALPPIPGEADDRRSRERAERAAEAPTAEREGRGRGRRGRGRERAPESTPATVVPSPGGPLSLAEGFDLLRSALRAMGSGAVHEDPLRDRMKLMLGRDDEIVAHRPRFGRFLRQAHDAAVVDLVKQSTGYEVTLRADAAAAAPAVEAVPAAEVKKAGRGRRGRGGRGKEATAAPAAEAAPAVTPAAPPTVPAAPAAGARRGLRWRKGSGSGLATAAQIPLVGVVDLDDEVPAATAPKAKAKRAQAAKPGTPKRGGSRRGGGKKGKGGPAAEA
jgi:uncharacterized protein (TIGR00288 family)